jgi:integrase
MASPTLEEAGEKLIEDMKAGFSRTRNGQSFKLRVVLDYQANMRLHLLPVLGAFRLDEITPDLLTKLVRRMLADGLSPSTIHNAFKPLRVIFREAVRSGLIQESPFSKVHMPVSNGKRDRIAPIEEAKTLISQLPDPWSKALWGCAFYAGMRRGEIMGLEWGDISASTIHVQRAWCQKTNQMQSTKTETGNRIIPIPEVLQSLLEEHRDGSTLEGLVFGYPNPSDIRRKAMEAWCPDAPQKKNGDRYGQLPYSLHEARHTYVSILVRAGVDVRAAMSYSGHTSVKVFMETYAKLFPGSQVEDAKRLDDFLGS